MATEVGPTPEDLTYCSIKKMSVDQQGRSNDQWFRGSRIQQPSGRAWFGGVSPSLLFHETAAHDGGCKFSGQAVVDRSKLLDGNKLQGGKFEGAGCNQRLKFRDCHLVQAPGHLTESGCTIGLKRRPPTDKGLFAKYQVRPRKNRKQMPSQWVIPGWSETDEYFASWLQVLVHQPQDFGGVSEMFEGIQRNDSARACRLTLG